MVRANSTLLNDNSSYRHKQVTAHFPYCVACRVWPCVPHDICDPVCTPPSTPRAWSCINVCKQHSVQWGVYFECIVCCRGSVTKHDKLKSINVREIETFVERTAACQYVRLCTCGCFVYLCVCVCIGGGGTMEPQYALARHPDRKWTVIGRKGEANRKHFPVKCLLLCSHVNTHTHLQLHTHTHTFIHRLLQLSHVVLAHSHTFAYTYMETHMFSYLFTHFSQTGHCLFPTLTLPAKTHTHTHLPGALNWPGCHCRRIEAEQNRCE